MRVFTKTMFVCLLAVTVSSSLYAQPGRGPGRGMGRGGMGRGPGPGGPGHGGPGGHQDERFEADQDVFHFLLSNHDKITRKVKMLPNGVDTLTESKDPKIAEKIKEHVHWMEYRIENTNPIRMRDPLFAELFKHTDKIVMEVEETKSGVRVIETSKDPKVAELIQAHAKVVSKFVERGFDEAMKNHPVPTGDKTSSTDFTFPKIKDYGGVIEFPEATQQPRENTKIVVDLTAGGEHGELYKSIDKLARFINIYKGAGSDSHDVTIAVVLHGDATFAAFNKDAYSEKFGVETNANLDCLRELHEADVEFYVCGQSLVRKGGKPEDVVVFMDLAVSGLTSMVNLQQDGYQYVPLF